MQIYCFYFIGSSSIYDINVLIGYYVEVEKFYLPKKF